MLRVKSREEIEQIRLSAQLVGRALGEVALAIEPGVSLLHLDGIANEYIKDHGGTPTFLGYNGFPNALCLSLNDVVVHGIPGSYELREGDILSVDCGVTLNGFVGDSAYTFPIGDISAEVERLLATTLECLALGIEKAWPNRRLGDISYAIQRHAESRGYGVVRELCGHGVGFDLHEKPEVANYGRQGSGMKLPVGLVIAIEPMINMGTHRIVQPDEWTIRTADKKPSAHYEHTVAITETGPDVLSTFTYIQEALKTKHVKAIVH